MATDPATGLKRAAHERRLAFGTMLMGGANIVKAAVQLVSLPIVARLLGPADYGLYGLAMPAVFLMLMIADSGLGASLAREPEDHVNIWSSAYWFLLGSGMVLMLGLSGSSFIVADLAHQPRLPPIMMALSVCVIFLVLAVPGNARLTRQGRLGVNSIGEALGNVVGAAAAIYLAWRGAGAWSLVAQALLTYAIRTTFIMLAAPFVPAWHFAFADLRAHLAVGGSILGTRLADTGGRMVESTLIARLVGTYFLGAYSFANQAPRFICESVSNALWAALYAQALQPGNEARALRSYFMVMRVFALLVFPVVALIAVQAPQLISFLLGARWLLATTMLRVLLISYALNIAGGFGSALLYARGRSDVQLRIMIEGVVMRIAGVALIPWLGITGMVAGFGLANILVFARGLFAVRRHYGSRLGAQLQVMAGPACASAAAAGLCWLARQYFAAGLLASIAEMAGCLAAYGALLLALEYRVMAADIAALRSLLRGRRAGQPA
jgi:PST family polysaccharide transporter